MAYSRKAEEQIAAVMHEKRKGTLQTGSGKKVTSRKQAIAIALSEARKAGAAVPKKRSVGKKNAAKKKAAPQKKGARKPATG